MYVLLVQVIKFTFTFNLWLTLFFMEENVYEYGEYGAVSSCDPVNDDTSCCSSSRQCGLGEGDCDDDEDCSGDLVCGTDNCAAGRATLDCCESKYHHVN